MPVPDTRPAAPAGKPETVAPVKSTVPEVNETPPVPISIVDTFANPSTNGFSVALSAPLSLVFSRPWYDVLILFPVNGVVCHVLLLLYYYAQTLVSASQFLVLKFHINGGGVGTPLQAASAIAYHQEPFKGCVSP